MKFKRLIFDLDGVIAINKGGDYIVDSVPDTELITLMQKVQKKGYTLHIYTARRMRTCKGNVGKVIANCGKATIEWLDKYKVPYDTLTFGKPYGSCYFDDLAINYSRESMFKKLKELLNEK